MYMYMSYALYVVPGNYRLLEDIRDVPIIMALVSQCLNRSLGLWDTITIDT